MEERLPLLPPLRWRLVRGAVRARLPLLARRPGLRPRLPRPRAGPSPGRTDEKLAEQVARIVARPLDRSRPLWELYLIHGLEDGHMAMLTKIHHALIDGLSGAEIMGVLFDLAPEGRELPEPTANGADRQPSELEMLTRGLMGSPRYPLRMLRSLPTRAAEPRRDAVREPPGRGRGGEGRRPAHAADRRPRERGARAHTTSRRRGRPSTAGSRRTAASPSASSRSTR